MNMVVMLKTLGMKWGFGPLTARDASAPDFLDVFTLSTPCPGSEWPTFTPLPLEAASTDPLTHPLNDLQKAILLMVRELDKAKTDLDEDMNVGKALDYIGGVLDKLLKEDF